MTLVELLPLRGWDDLPEEDWEAFNWLGDRTREAADLIERQATQIEVMRSAILQFRNEPILARAQAIRRTAGYAAMQDAALDTTPQPSP